MGFSFATTVAGGSFRGDTDGFVSGTLLNDPVDRQRIEGGFVNTTGGDIIWGGMPIKLLTPAPGAATTALGPAARLATTHAEIMAWCIFDQANAGVITATSPAPLYTSGNSLNFVRAKSNVRIVLPVDPTIVSALSNASELGPVSWDFSAKQIIAFDSSNTLDVDIEFLSITSLRPAYSSPNLTWNPAGAVAVCRLGR